MVVSTQQGCEHWMGRWVTPSGQVALLTASGAQFHSLVKCLLNTLWGQAWRWVLPSERSQPGRCQSRWTDKVAF